MVGRGSVTQRVGAVEIMNGGRCDRHLSKGQRQGDSKSKRLECVKAGLSKLPASLMKEALFYGTGHCIY
jgi:hypothetical protein